MREFTEQEAKQHDALYRRGWALTEGELWLEGVPSFKPANFFARMKLKKAISCFEQVLIINPESWNSMWALGKIYQRLQQDEESFNWFKKAHEINPQQIDVAREASLAALNLGKAEEALYLCQWATQLAPNDPGLVANLAWAYVISGNIELALETINKAVEADPEDDISRAVLRIINEIAQGTRPVPKNMLEIIRFG